MPIVAHLAPWVFPDGSVGCATRTEFRQQFVDRIKAMKDSRQAQWVDYLSITVFKPSVHDLVRRALLDIFGREACPVCLALGPCWMWQGFVSPTNMGHVVDSIIPRPTSAVQRTALATSIYNGLTRAERDAFQILAQAVPHLLDEESRRRGNVGVRQQTRLPTPRRRDVELRWSDLGNGDAELYRQDLLEDLINDGAIDLDEEEPPPPRRRPERPVPAPQPQQHVAPAGSVRCHSCGQVIPPGFKKEDDKTKTIEDIQAACSHEWDDNQVCKKCKMPENARFSRLEID